MTQPHPRLALFEVATTRTGLQPTVPDPAAAHAAVVVEDRYSNLFKLEHTKPGFVTELLAALTVRYPTVPIHFGETRPLAEDWTYRFLGAALAYAQAGTNRADKPRAGSRRRSDRSECNA